MMRDIQNSERRGRVCNGCDKAAEEPHFLFVWVANYIQVSLCFEDAVFLFISPKAVTKH